MTTMMTPEQQLTSAFDEVDWTQSEVTKAEKNEQKAQKKAGDTNGLAAAAQRDLRNAEATYRVLFAAVEETSALHEREEQIRRDLIEIGRVERIRSIAHAALESLHHAVAAVGPFESATREARENTHNATTQVQQAVVDVTAVIANQGTPVGTQGTASTAATKPGARGRKPRAAAPPPSPSQVVTALEGIQGGLEADHRALDHLHREVGRFRRGLEHEVTAVGEVENEAADFARELEPKKAPLEVELAEIEKKLADEPTADEVRRNKAAVDAAQRRFQDAPATERQAQEALKLAREAREDAERRHREALDRRDRVERLFVTGIDITGPNAAGIFKATAVIAEKLPKGYELHWSSNAGSVYPTRGDEVDFNTGKLPPGSYDIEVSVVRP
jgi:hypothetical protein